MANDSHPTEPPSTQEAVETVARAIDAARTEMRRQGFSGGWEPEELVTAILASLSHPPTSIAQPDERAAIVRAWEAADAAGGERGNFDEDDADSLNRALFNIWETLRPFAQPSKDGGEG